MDACLHREKEIPSSRGGSPSSRLQTGDSAGNSFQSGRRNRAGCSFPVSGLSSPDFRACRALPVPRCRSGQKLRHPPKPYTPDMAFLIDLSHLSFRCHYDLVVFPHYRTHTGIAGYRGGQQHPVKVQKVAQSVGFLLPFELAVQGWSMGLFPFVNPFRMVYLRSQWSGKEYSWIISGIPAGGCSGPCACNPGLSRVGNKPYPVPAVGSSDGTSRYKYRLDGISSTFKITANGFNNILLPSFKYRLTL